LITKLNPEYGDSTVSETLKLHGTRAQKARTSISVPLKSRITYRELFVVTVPIGTKRLTVKVLILELLIDDLRVVLYLYTRVVWKVRGLAALRRCYVKL